MNIYKILKLSKRIRNSHINLAGIFVFHVFRRRYLGIFLDPVLACDLRCQICHFSEGAYRKNLSKKMLDVQQIEKRSKAFFYRALKLQIGCAAEPTVYKGLATIIKFGKDFFKVFRHIDIDSLQMRPIVSRENTS
ncbi:MAG: hypothetical protein BGN96_10050 [Bacteroidales bacterium 45-6]|nr:MAG: hypothetical protein BGN96_10050 [Bacteroidales bacterium 45-6]